MAPNDRPRTPTAPLAGPSARRNGNLQTVDRALLTLLAFREHDSWGVTELARHLDVDKSIAQRLLSTLAQRQFVLADPETRRYRLGPAITVLGRAAERGDGLEMLARPLLRRLANTVDQSAILSIPHGSTTRCTAAVDAHGPIRYSTIVGETMPGYAGAAGHAIFAHYPPDDLNRIFGTEPFPRHSEDTVSDLTALLPLYDEVRSNGVATSHGEYDAGVTCVAAPSFLDEEVVASVAVIGPRERVDADLDACKTAVIEAAAALTTLLQGHAHQSPSPTPSGR